LGALGFLVFGAAFGFLEDFAFGAFGFDPDFLADEPFCFGFFSLAGVAAFAGDAAGWAAVVSAFGASAAGVVALALGALGVFGALAFGALVFGAFGLLADLALDLLAFD